LDELPEALVAADIVVAATASPHLLLEVREIADVMRAREGRALLLIDLAVPRDIDAACAGLDGVTLFDIDDLQAVATRNRKGRQAEARRAEGIIEEEIQKFAAWLGSLEVLPTLAALRSLASDIAGQVVAENRGKWESASPRDLERIDAVARAVVNRILHEPTLQMKAMHDDRVHARMAVIRELFGLTVEEGAPGAEELDAWPDEELAQVRELPIGPTRPARGQRRG
jgi:glutamyl-tRNA reductase